MKSIIFLVALFLLTACGGDSYSNTTADNNKSKHSDKLYKIMPLGDSITYDDARAYYDKNGKDLVPAGKRTAYRSFLAYDLKDAGIKFDFVGSRRAGYDVEPKFDPDNEGHPGWTSFDISKKVYGYLVTNTPDIILLHIGTNDRAGGRVDGTEKILNEIKRFEKDHNRKIHVFVALIINRWLWDKTIEKYNKNLKAMLEARNDPEITIVDMSELISGGHHDYLENTHPNKQGYKKIADKWFIALSDYLLK